MSDKKESILEEALRLIHGPRNKNYGHPRENFKDIADLFSAYLGQEITDIDVANLMILVKIARVKGTGYHRDSFTDIAGYAGCVERIYEEEPEDAEPRQFNFLTQIPEGVTVVEADEVPTPMYLRRKNGRLEVGISPHDGPGWIRWDEQMRKFHSPFTEVRA